MLEPHTVAELDFDQILVVDRRIDRRVWRSIACVSLQTIAVGGRPP